MSLKARVPGQARSASGPGFWTGRSELLVAALVAAIGTVMLVRTRSIDSPPAGNFLGPRFFPIIVGSLLLVLSVALAVEVLRRPRANRSGAVADDATVAGTSGGEEHSSIDNASRRSDWKPLVGVAATLTLHLLLLQPLGWLIAGTLLFWGISSSLGGRHPLRDLGIAVVVSSAVQVGFSTGLGLSLPSGLLMRVF